MHINPGNHIQINQKLIIYITRYPVIQYPLSCINAFGGDFQSKSVK